MAAAVDELRHRFMGAWVDQVYQPDPLSVVLAFTGGGPRRFWMASSDARWARSHAVGQRPAGGEMPPAFCMLLRKHLNGSHLTGMEQVRFDRILRLTFVRGGEERVLVHEVMGKHSNLLLLDEGGTILGAVKNVPAAQSRVRPVLPGLPYTPIPDDRADPRDLTPGQLRERLAGVADAAGITSALSGWGTFAAREALARGGEPAEQVHRLMEAVQRSEFQPLVLEEADGRPKGVWAFPSVQAGWEHGTPAGSLSTACERFYLHLESTAALEARRKTVLGTLQRALKTARIQLTEAEAALEGLEAAELLKIQGELLAGAGSRVERGTEAVALPNWYDPDQKPLRIALDPELDGRENAERYFHRYRRATAAAETALERIPELTGQVAALERLAEEAETADEERLQLLMPEAREAAPRLVHAPHQQSAPQGGKRPEPEFPSGVRIKRVPCAGWEILYGENATSNDFLTTKLARPADLWLHARAVTGAHVVIRDVHTLDRLPPDVLREAARIAAAHSEARHSSVVPVDYTFRRYVRKPRGSGPGRVTYSAEKTVDVDPSTGSRAGQG